MSLQTLLLVIGLMLLIFAPFFILYMKRMKKEKRIIEQLSNLAEKNNCIISEHETWNDSVIGIDKTSFKLLLIRNGIENKTALVVDLSDKQKCRVLNISRDAMMNEGGGKITDRIALSFENRDKTKPEKVLDLYNNTYDGLRLTGEIHLSEKWSKIANDCIAHGRKKAIIQV